MRLACAEGNGVPLDRGTSQSTARIARTARNVAFCRTFLRTILLLVIVRRLEVIDRSYNYRRIIDRVGMW